MTPMQVRWAGRLLGFTILTAALVHTATVWLLPQLTARSALSKAEELGGFNRIVHLDPATAGTNLLPRPDPATLESVCAFDIDGGPVRLTLPQDSPPLAVTIVANNATPIFSGTPDSAADSIVVGSEKQAARLGGVVSISPGAKGIIRVRILALDETMRQRAETARRQMDCGYAS